MGKGGTNGSLVTDGDRGNGMRGGRGAAAASTSMWAHRSQVYNITAITDWHSIMSN